MGEKDEEPKRTEEVLLTRENYLKAQFMCLADGHETVEDMVNYTVSDWFRAWDEEGEEVGQHVVDRLLRSENDLGIP